MVLFMRRGLATLVALYLCSAASAEDITGAGSTFVSPILSKWSADYGAKTGTVVKYQSIGSSGGIAQIKLDFGVTDGRTDISGETWVARRLQRAC